MSSSTLTGLRLTIGVILSIGIGVVVYFFTSALSIMSLVAGLQVTLLTLQVESLIRERRTDQKETRQNRIMGSVERVTWMPDIIEKIAQSTAAVEEKFPGTIATEMSRRILEDCTNELGRLEFGQILFDYEEIGPLVGHANRARTSIVWDTSCGYETRTNERGEGQWNYFTFQAEEIRRMIVTYNLIYNASTDLQGENQRCILH